MTLLTKTIKIQHLTLGVLLQETFVNPVQFKLFLKLVNGCLMLKEDLTYFNGEDFLINIPHSVLKESIISTSFDSSSLTEQIITKSKIEQPS